MRISRKAAGVAAAAAMLATLPLSPAQADTNTTSATALAAIGSDTADDVYEALSLLPSLSGDIANYKTVPIGRDIDTSANYPGAGGRPAAANCITSGPRGSTEGKNGLRASMQGEAYVPLDPVAPVNPGSTNYTGCAGIARSSSSSFPAGTAAGSMARIPFAVDALAPAVLKNSTVPKKLTATFLKDLYTRNGVAGSAACFNIVPLVPSFSAGTRAFWASALGISDYDFSGTGGTIGTPPATGTTWGSCVTGGAANSTGVGTGAGNGLPGDRKGGANGTPIQEHQGSFLDAGNQILPYSVAQWTVQGSGVVTDIRGGAVLASVDFTSLTNTVTDANVRHPFALNGQGSAAVGYRGPTANFTRQMFTFVPRTLVDATFTAPAQQVAFTNVPAADVARFQQAFIGSTSDVCTSSATILLYGLAPDVACGTATFGP
ncbi:MAG: hypothetical protein HY830_03470 [Actinobacteria bacterium]|nr:hypothetical protein [Actinomycetota bacterium]